MTPTARKHRDLGALHALLIRACPPVEDKLAGETYQSIPALARELKITKNAIYLWISLNEVPAERAQRILEVANGRISKEELSLFVNTPAWFA